MLRYFPRLYDDEFLYSAIARFHHHIGNNGFKTTLQELFGSRSVCAAVDLPSHINDLVKRLPKANHLSADIILQRHTLFPYYARYLEQSSKQYLKSAMLGNRGNGIQTKSGIVAFKIKPSKFLKLCPVCVSENLKMTGETYWHRSHNLPGCLVCALHHIPLIETTALYHPAGKHDFIDANDVEWASISEQVPAHDVNTLVAIAHRSELFLQNNFKIEIEPNVYRDALLQRGYARGNNINQPLLEEVFIDRFTIPLLNLCGCHVECGDETNWLRTIVRKHRKAMHPLYHVLIQLFFEEQKIKIMEPILKATKRSISEPEQIAEKRSQWLDALRKTPDENLKQIRQRNYALYAWLYRHDKEWLSQNLPSRKTCAPQQRIDWLSRDSAYCGQLQILVQNRDKEKPIWRSRTKLLNSLKCPSTIEKNRCKLPNTWRLLESLAETRIAFQIRRIEWAAKELSDPRELLQAWRIVKKAGLREPLHVEVERKLREIIGAIRS